MCVCTSYEFHENPILYVNLSYVLVAAPRLKWCACRVFVVVCYSNVFLIHICADVSVHANMITLIVFSVLVLFFVFHSHLLAPATQVQHYTYPYVWRVVLSAPNIA